MKNESIKTPAFTLCFPSLFEPRAMNPNQEPKYSCTAVFPAGTDLSALKRIVLDAVKAAWPNGAPRGARSPFLDGNKDANPEWGECFKDATFIRFSTKFKPPVCDASRREITDPDAVYGGQKCVAIVHCYAYSNAGNNGVAFGLDALQVVADGERIGGVNKEALFGQFDQLATPAPSPLDFFGDTTAPANTAAPAAAGTTTAGALDPFTGLPL